MTHTSKAALELLGPDLEGAARYGDEQISYVSSQFFKDFMRNAFGAVLVAGMPDIRKHHDACLASGRTMIGDVAFSARTAEEKKILDVSFPDGEILHIDWTDENDGKSARTEITIRNGKARISDAAITTRDSMLGSASLRDMMPIAEEFARDLNEQGERLGGASIFRFVDNPRTVSRGWSDWSGCRIDLLERLSSVLDLSLGRDEVDFQSEEHLGLAEKGLLLPMFASAAALAFETDVLSKLPQLAEIASLSADLRLGSGTVLTYGDYDRHFSGASTKDRDVLVHNNVDRNEPSVFVLVVNRHDGEALSVDMHIADAWYRDFEEWADLDLDDTADAGGFASLVEYAAERLLRPNEDELVAEILQNRSTRGLAYSYDMANCTLELGEAAFHTGFMAYAGLMIEQDLDALRMLRSGELDGAGGMSVDRHEIGSGSHNDKDEIDPAEYLAGLQLPEYPTL